jgi:hypothetical protein
VQVTKVLIHCPLTPHGGQLDFVGHRWTEAIAQIAMNIVIVQIL